MNIVLDFTDVLSPGIDRFIKLHDQCNTTLLTFLKNFHIQMETKCKVNQRTFTLTFNNAKFDEVFDTLSIMSERYPFLAYELYLFKKNVKIREMCAKRFVTGEDKFVIVIAKSNKPTTLYDCRERILPDVISQIFNLKKEFNGSYFLSKDVINKTFDKNRVKFNLLNASVCNNDSWIGHFDNDINSFNIYVDIQSKSYPNFGHSLEVFFNHAQSVQKVRLIGTLHKDQPLHIFDVEFTFAEFSYWLNGVGYNLHHENFCNGFMFNRLINYLKTDDINVES